jgi:CubicO group peptidase (beta-lactamase class C family)
LHAENPRRILKSAKTIIKQGVNTVNRNAHADPRLKIEAPSSRSAFLSATAAVGLVVIGGTSWMDRAHAQRASPNAAASSPSLGQALPESVGMSSARLGRMTAAFKKEVEDKKLVGAVLMVARKGKLVYSTAFGTQDPTGTSPMKADTIFRIYSMTKPFASVALMLLVEDGIVQLTDPVAKWLPSFKDAKVSAGQAGAADVAAERAPTVQDLLRHTAGLPYGEITANAAVKEMLAKAGVYQPGKIDFDSRDMPGPEQADRMGKIPLVNQPGTKWEYSLATDIVGRVVEQASGKRLGEFLAERVFKPLKMNDTAFHVPEAKKARLAEPFDKDPATGTPNKLIDVSKVPSNDSGGAGAVSTTGDYLRFTQMLLNGGTLDGVRIMSRSTIKLMTSDHLATIVSNQQQPGKLLLGTDGYTFGLGFAVRMQDGIAGVPGSAGEYMWAGYGGTYFWVDPKEQITAVYMTQAPSPQRAFYRKMVKSYVYQALID